VAENARRLENGECWMERSVSVAGCRDRVIAAEKETEKRKQRKRQPAKTKEKPIEKVSEEHIRVEETEMSDCIILDIR
jgi:hypothetical protein